MRKRVRNKDKMITQSTHVTLSPNVLFQQEKNEAVLLNLKSEQYYSLDDVGTQLWQLLDQYHDSEHVASLMSTKYDVDEMKLCADLADLIRQLVSAGLVTATCQRSSQSHVTPQAQLTQKKTYHPPRLRAYGTVPEMTISDTYQLGSPLVVLTV